MEGILSKAAVLPGQETLVASWHALTSLSPGARLVHSATCVAAVFPAWAPLNNAIAHGLPDRVAASSLANLYRAAGVAAWALWLPSPATDLEQPDEVAHLDGYQRDTTTLAMRMPLRRGERQAFRRHDAVVRTSVAAATRATDDPVPVSELAAPDEVAGLAAWVLVQDEVAVAGAWSFCHEDDCGIYAVGTCPEWRRRGLAHTLMQHVLADAADRGARTATLQSTRMGQPLYAALGFEPVGRYEEWSSQQTTESAGR